MYVIIAIIGGLSISVLIMRRGKSKKSAAKVVAERQSAQKRVADLRVQLRSEQEDAARRARLRDNTQQMLQQYRAERAAEQCDSGDTE